MVNLNEYIWALVQLLNPFVVEASTYMLSLSNTEVVNRLNQIENCCHSFLTNRFGVPPFFLEFNEEKNIISSSNVNFFVKKFASIFIVLV